MPPPLIRHPSPADAEAIAGIYATCFPDRMQAVFGGAHRRTFLVDYIRFYLAWDPANTWVCGEPGAVSGVSIAPCRYAPRRVAFGQAASWLWHGLTGRYGFPLHIVRLFLRSGFSFNDDPVIRELWGKPYIHLFAVAPGRQRQGIGSALMGWTLQQYRQQGVHSCWLMVQRHNAGAIAFYETFGFRVRGPVATGDLVMVWNEA